MLLYRLITNSHTPRSIQSTRLQPPHHNSVCLSLSVAHVPPKVLHRVERVDVLEVFLPGLGRVALLRVIIPQHPSVLQRVLFTHKIHKIYAKYASATCSLSAFSRLPVLYVCICSHLGGHVAHSGGDSDRRVLKRFLLLLHWLLGLLHVLLLAHTAAEVVCRLVRNWWELGLVLSAADACCWCRELSGDCCALPRLDLVGSKRNGTKVNSDINSEVSASTTDLHSALDA